MQVSSEYLDVAIGLAAIFFFASLVVSALADGVQWPLRVRSKFLWAYLYDLTNTDRNNRKLPRGAAGITTLWGKRNDTRPQVGDAPHPTEGAGHPAVTAQGGGLDHVARALDPIDAPQLTTTPGARKPKRTSIQNIPPASLAQAFLEVFAEAGRARLDDATQQLGRATVAGDADPIAVAAARLGALLHRDRSDPSAAAAAFTQFGLDVHGAVDDAALVAAGAALAGSLGGLADVTLTPDLAMDATAFARALKSTSTESTAADRAESARRLVTGIMRSMPDRFSRERVESAIEDLGDSPLGITARRLWDGAKREVDTFRTSLEGYFDNEMSRLSGYYKRSIRIVLIVLAIIVTLVANIDALTVAEGLWRNPDGRAALISQADQLAVGELADADVAGALSEESPASEPTLALLRQACRELAPPPAGNAMANDDQQLDPADVAAGLQRVRGCVDDALSELSGLGVVDRALWASPSKWLDDFVPWYRTDGEQKGDWVRHTLGVALTAGALVLGSSFWFDLIKRLTGLRRGLVGQT